MSLPVAPPNAPRPSQWEGSLRWPIVAVIVLVGLLVVAYRYGIPALARVASGFVPQTIVDVVSRQTLEVAEAQMFEPTALSMDRQAAIAREFAALHSLDGNRAPTREYRLLFRKSDQLGPNALALPSGALIVTDALVSLTADNRDIAAVLAHEAGHVEHSHGLRLFFQNSFLALAMAWVLGDTSTLLAAAPAALLEAKYSRDLEREADAYAVSVLRSNGMSVEHLARMLERLETSAKGASGAGVFGYLSSHPVTSERLEALRGAQ